MMEQIFKIQRPLYTTGESQTILIYNEDKSVFQEIAVSEQQVSEMFPNLEYKVYMLGSIGKDGMLNLSCQTEEQDW